MLRELGVTATKSGESKVSFSLPKFLRRAPAESLKAYFDERGYFRRRIDWDCKQPKLIEHICADIRGLAEPDRHRVFDDFERVSQLTDEIGQIALRSTSELGQGGCKPRYSIKYRSARVPEIGLALATCSRIHDIVFSRSEAKVSSARSASAVDSELDWSSISPPSGSMLASCIDPEHCCETPRSFCLGQLVQVSEEANWVATPSVAREICPSSGPEVYFKGPVMPVWATRIARDIFISLGLAIGEPASQ
jgi:hypothetical protein